MASEGNEMTPCRYCGSEIGANALYCPKCLVPVAIPPHRRRPGTLTLLLSVSLLFGSPCVWVIAGQFHSSWVKAVTPVAVHAAAPPAPRVVDQAVALIKSCGAPDRDVSTAYNNPRPPIPFRIVDYENAHLEFGFIPGGGAQIGDPPPYTWALSGIVDTTTHQRLTPEQAAERMNCAAPLEKDVTQAANTSPSDSQQSQ
jgi:hypothetical protein